MRASYLTYLVREYKKGRYLTPFKEIGKYFLLILSRFIGRPLTGPIHASIVVNYNCNLHCPMCDLWKKPAECRQGSVEKLTTPEMEKVIDDFAAIGTSGVGFTGGEPILRKDVLHLISYARSKGLVTHLSTNGYLMSKKEVAQRVVSSGLDAIAFSIDGVNPQTHDRLRGLPGSYEKAIEGIKNFLEIRKEEKREIVVMVVCVVSEENLEEINALMEKMKNLGVDYVSFLPLHKVDELKPPQRHSPCPRFSSANLKRLDLLIDQLLKDQKRRKVDNSSSYLKLFKRCFRGESLPIKCYASFVACCVDGYGNVFPCFPWLVADRGPVKNVREISFKDYWNSEHFNLVRKRIRGCRACYWNNQTELNILFTFKNVWETLMGLFSWRKFS
jgi:MoaA/NifB/PqqE/SkfB family radical SAM enzyme